MHQSLCRNSPQCAVIGWTKPELRYRPDGMRSSYAWYGLLSLPVLAVLAFTTLRPIVVLPRIALAPGYALLDQAGQPLTNEDMRGRVVLYNFTYTSCSAEACAQIDETMRRVEEQIAQMDTGGLPVHLVTISFDPERDTPEQLDDYAAELGADTRTWHFATGDPDRLKYIIGNGFSTFYQRNDDGSFTFDPAFLLVDGAGILRAEYRTATPDGEIILRDVGLIVQETLNSTGAARYAYEAAHLFVCYPR
jgi:protein SCO1